MGSGLINRSSLKWVMLAFFAFSTVACDNAVFSSNKVEKTAGDGDGDGGGGGLDVVDDITFIDDSFERDNIYTDAVTEIIYGWRGFILDGATSVFDFQSNGAGARIPPIGELGPAADGRRFLLLNGRPAQGIETTHVISQSFDLNQFNTAILSFRYLTFNLNDPNDTDLTEGVELQVCRGTLNDCGANDDSLFAPGLTSNNWVTVAVNDPTFNDDAFNGKNHTVTDWKTAVAVIDLNNPQFVGDSSTFVFRFRAAMREGLNTALTGEICNWVCDKKDKHGKKCKDKKSHHDNGNHYGFDHSNHYGYDRQTSSSSGGHDDDKCKHNNCKKICRKECHTIAIEPDGTLKDGVAIDKVIGIATQRNIEEVL